MRNPLCEMCDLFQPPPRNWLEKFRDAGVGVWRGVRGQSSFAVHILAAIAVIIAAAALGVNLVQWGLLLLCVTIVLAAEMFNSALETLAKAVDDQYNTHLKDALNIASGAVLIASIGAVVVGVLVFGQRFGVLLDWW